MTRPSLHASCTHCVALCCVALSFDRSEHFAFDKAAGTACPHLTTTFHCAIHARRAELGFSGCSRYDCLGAGQRVTALFGAEAASREPKTTRRMADAFALMRRIHEALELLAYASRLPLSAAHEARRLRLESDLIAASSGLEQLAATADGELLRKARALLLEIRPAARSPMSKP